MFKLPSSLPLCVGGVASRGFGAGTSRHSCRSNATFLKVYSVSSRPARILSVLGSKSCSRCGLAYMCSPDHGFYRLDRPLALSGPKVCTIIALFACTFRKRLLTATQNSNCALRLVLLSFSLRFCSAFKTYCKTRAKIKIVVPKLYTLHTVSTHKRYFEKHFRKTLLARTRVQSVRAECTFTVVLT